MNDPNLTPIGVPTPHAPTLADLIAAEVRQQVAPALDEIQSGLGQHVATIAQQTVSAAIDPLIAGHQTNAQGVEEAKDTAKNAEQLALDNKGALASVLAPGVVAVKGSLNTASHDLWIPRIVVGGAVAFILLFAGFYLSGSHQAADLWVAVLPTLAAIGAVAGRMLLAAATGSATGTPPA